MGILRNTQYEKAAQARAAGVGVTDAYVEGGFKRNPQAASKFFRRPDVSARVAEIIGERVAIEDSAREKIIEKVALTREWVLDRLRYNAERCLRGRPVLDSQGRHTGQFSGMPDGNAANRALELLGRELGMFRQQVEVGKPGEFDGKTDEQLENDAYRLAAKLGIAVPDPAKMNGKTRH